ncbi:MAG: hypothetical protein K0R26_1620 [Bacteroidota bacterium]|jgi:hypothetical protein|nr:hypothetical protein [Bacteroidota bacterium]
MSAYTVFKKTETATAVISLCGDGIIRVMLKKNSEVTAENVDENIEVYKAFSGNNTYAFLVYSENGTVVYTDEARKRAKELEPTFQKSCMAVLVSTLGHRLIANFYLNVYRPSFPYRVFNKMNEAEAWCLEQQQPHISTKNRTLVI